MKLPNGFGTVYKLSGNRRRPYVVKKTIQHRQKALGYFETFEDAMAYLVEYNHDPALLSPSKTTFSEVYALWKAQHFPRLRSEARTVTKLILGHSLEGVTERVYTHKSVRELLRTIDKVCT
nr:hypothetical protein [Mitsuokella multacida]